MKFVTYSQFESHPPRFGFKKGHYIIDVLRAAIWAKQSRERSEFLDIPTSLKRALEHWHEHYRRLQELAELLPETNLDSYTVNDKAIAMEENQIILHPPVPVPRAFRSFDAFEQHARRTRKLQGLEMDPLWYDLPAFHFSNPNTLYGHKATIPYPVGSQALDYALQIAVIIGHGGKNISAPDADILIAGYTILNDWSARDFQRREMKLSLGPAKGKDFAASVGPYMVTPDELSPAWSGNKLHLQMTCRVNGVNYSAGNTSDMYHSFAAMIEYASRNAELTPGDLMGSGTVGAGCIFELRPENTRDWLKPGDTVVCEIERLGKLENIIGST